MRSHGTAITDIVILIVAADDGVMPQTIEVIEQSKKNNVPIIVAINKIDKPAADPNKVKQQLAEYQLTPEEWGGETIFVETSAETGKGIDDLLEAIAIFADMKNYQANPDEKATGVVIESFMHKGSGPVATILIENGSLRKGDPVVIGNQWGRVRILQDTLEKDIDLALPSMPIRIAGLRGLPNFGDRLLVVESEKEAKNQAQIDQRQPQTVDFVSARRLSSDDQIEDKVVELNLVVKADVKGSLGAIKKLFNDINHPEVKIKIVHEGIGPISESDVNMAKASSAIVVGFRVKILAVAKKLAELEAVKIYHQTIIYDLLKKVKEEMSVLLPPETIEKTVGKLKVLAIFRYDKKKTIFGGIVEEGEINRKDQIKILRGQKEIYRGEIKALRHGKDEASSVSSGSECGISVDGLVDVLKDDLAIAFKEEIIKKIVE
jgi:translation initiation factor IF-2